MRHGHEKSRSAIVAVKPTNKAERSAAEQSAAETTAAESVERRAETKGNVDQQRTRRTQRRISVSQMLARIRQHIVAVDTRGGNRMRESCTYGSLRGVRGNSHPYRDMANVGFWEGFRMPAASTRATNAGGRRTKTAKGRNRDLGALGGPRRATSEKRRELLDPLYVVMLGLLRKLADRHVFNHAPAQRAHRLVGHGDAPVLREVGNPSCSRQDATLRYRLSRRACRSNLPRERFSRVLGMLSSLEVKVLRST